MRAPAAANRLIRLPARKAAHRAGSRRGQAFLELGISLVFLLILFSVMVDLGYAFYTLMAMRDAAQEAASYGAICPYTSTGERNDLLIRERLRLSATSPLDMRDIDINDITIQFTDTDGNIIEPPGVGVLGGSVVVTFTIRHQIMVPFLGAIIGRNDYPLTVTVADTVIRSKWLDQCDY